MLGLWKAVLSFDSTRGASFAAYARLCIERQIISAVRAASAHKHEPLNSSLPLEKPLFTGDGTPQPQAPTLSDPEELVIGMEEQPSVCAGCRRCCLLLKNRCFPFIWAAFLMRRLPRKPTGRANR